MNGLDIFSLSIFVIFSVFPVGMSIIKSLPLFKERTIFFVPAIKPIGFIFFAYYFQKHQTHQ